MSDITVAIPNYNHGKFLGQSIDSALKEGCRVIVIDDGSTDHSAEVMRSFGDEITCLYHDENTGKASVGLNEALALTETDWFAFVAADDYVQPGFGTLPDPDFDWVFCEVGIDSGRGPVPMWSYQNWSTDPQQGIDRVKSGQSIGMPYLGVQRTDFVRKAGGWFAHPNTNFAEDTATNIRWLTHFPRVKYDPRPLYAIREHANRLTHTLGPTDDGIMFADLRELVRGLGV